jgi:hypothetical protein
VSLPGRPTEMPATEQVDVEMKYRLSCSRTYVEYRAVSVLDISLARDLSRRQVTASDHLGIANLRFLQTSKMFLWDHEDMRRRLRIDVFDGEHVLVLIDFLRGNLAAENAAEKAIAGGIGHWNSGVSIALDVADTKVVSGQFLRRMWFLTLTDHWPLITDR